MSDPTPLRPMGETDDLNDDHAPITARVGHRLYRRSTNPLVYGWTLEPDGAWVSDEVHDLLDLVVKLRAERDEAAALSRAAGMIG